MDEYKYEEIKTLLTELNDNIKLLIPKHSTIAYISAITGKSRQTIRAYIISNFEPLVEYWYENGKIILSQTATLEILRKYHERKR